VKVLAGTSGYSYANWKGHFYPRDLGAAKMLAHYAERLPTVEVNNTFYKRPNANQLDAWAAQTPATFEFAFKASRYFSAGTGLRDAKAVSDFFTLLGRLKARLGPVFVQLPAHLKMDVGLLAELALAARTHRVALDLVDPSWRCDAVHQLAADHDIALSATEDEERSTPFTVTGRWAYVRLRKARYDARAIERWTSRLHDAKLTSAYVFFKHEASGPDSALALCRAAERLEGGRPAE
jgi:uncharacterized protein YecE (DUF72 family)